jgi:hypothetical protein
MMKRFVHGLMALTVAGGLALAAAPQAEARGRDVGVGIAAGIIGLGVGAAIADSARGPRYYSRYDDRCYRGEERCHRTPRRCFENEFGDTICRGGRYICERPLICD